MTLSCSLFPDNIQFRFFGSVLLWAKLPPYPLDGSMDLYVAETKFVLATKGDIPALVGHLKGILDPWAPKSDKTYKNNCKCQSHAEEYSKNSNDHE